MVSPYVEKITITCSPIVTNCFGVIIVASTDKEFRINPSKCKCWKVMDSCASQLKSGLECRSKVNTNQ